MKDKDKTKAELIKGLTMRHVDEMTNSQTARMESSDTSITPPGRGSKLGSLPEGMGGYRLLVETIPHGIAKIDTKGRIIYGNSACFRIMGYQKEKVLGRPVWDFLSSEDEGERMKESLQFLVKDQPEPTPCFQKSRTGDGRLIDLQLDWNYERDGHGNLAGFISVLTDVTDIGRAKSEEKFRTLFESSSDAIFILDMNGNFIDVNRTAHESLGYTRQEMLSMNVSQLYATEFAAGIPERITEISKEGKAVFEAVHTRKDGSLMPVEMRASIIDFNGEKVFLGSIRDITERKKSELALTSAKLEAEKANLAKSEFLANMSHEIRSPIQTIIGMSELLTDTDLTELQRDYLEICKNACDNLLELISDILDISRIEMGHFEIEVSTFNLNELLNGIISSFSYRAKKKGLQLSLTVSKDTPAEVVGDELRLRQVIVNLVGNAIKFTEKGHVSIEVNPARSRSRPESAAAMKNGESGEGSSDDTRQAERCVVQFTVRDSGIGIPAARIESVFGSFIQVDSSNTKEHGGAGLGLAISKRLVEKMGGEMKAESEPGKGSSFSFTVPVAIKGGEHPSEAETEEILPEERRRTRILLVEDSEDIMLLLQSFIKNASYRLETAENGTTALQKFKAGRFEIVFMDIQMPVMDGYTACREIRKWEEESGVEPTPIIALTAHAIKEYEGKSFEAGFTAHVSKPIKKNKFLRAIYKYAKRRAA